MHAFARTICSSALLTVLAMLAGPCAAQGAFAGAWEVVKAQDAPWLAHRPELKAFNKPGLLRARFEFRAGRVIAPGWMGCKKARYEMMSLGFDALFEGGLSDPGKGLNDPAALARALGFTGEPVTSMLTACSELLFHLVDQQTAQFALDNRIYTLRRAVVHPAPPVPVKR